MVCQCLSLSNSSGKSMDIGWAEFVDLATFQALFVLIKIA